LLTTKSIVTAQDPKAAYYDPKDTDPEKPKWSVVHVEFRRKLKEMITLSELREFAEKDGKLAQMQMLKQSRLSVSKVSKEEWQFLLGVADEQEDK
jgi:predicted RNA-binding protein with PUA-like domain